MICSKCATQNEDGSKYCKECGERLDSSASVSRDEYLRIGELIYAAYKHSEAGRLDDAILACQGALALNSENASAYSLLASLYERKGDTPNAIAAYERVVALNPTSDADRRRLSDLKAGRVKLPKPAGVGAGGLLPRLKPYLPYLAGGLVLVVVLVLGLCAIRSSDRGRTVQAEPQRQSSGPSGVAPIPLPGTSPGGSQPSVAAPGQQAPPQSAPAAGSEASARVETGTAAQTTGEEGRPTAQTSRPPRPGVPPVPMPSAATSAAEPKPAAPSARSTTESTPVIVPVEESPRPSAPAPSPPPRATASPPRASITFHQPPETLLGAEERAGMLQNAGKYREAIAAYSEALSQTTDAGRVYQRIADCHRLLGEHSQAIDNYNRAIRSYRDQLAAGADPTRIQRSIQSCEAGIQVSRTHAR